MFFDTPVYFAFLAIVVLLVLHITLTYKPIIQLLLLLAVTFHAALGLRVILPCGRFRL